MADTCALTPYAGHRLGAIHYPRDAADGGVVGVMGVVRTARTRGRAVWAGLMVVRLACRSTNMSDSARSGSGRVVRTAAVTKTWSGARPAGRTSMTRAS